MLPMEDTILKNILIRTGVKGLLVNMTAFTREEEALQTAGAAAQANLNKLAGRSIVAHSSKDVGTLLYEEMGLPAARTKTGAYSASLDALRRLGSLPIVDAIVAMKKVQANLKYFKIARKFMREGSSFGPVTIPFQFETESVSGRIYGKEPSVMSFPASIRKCIIPDPGNEFVHADYDREELCLLAHYNGDTQFLEDVKNGVDIFQELADAFDPDAREKVKTTIYAYFYGANIDHIAEKTGVEPKMVGESIVALKTRYPKLAEAPAKIIEQVKAKGYVETMIDRRRYTINTQNPDYEQEIRRACNFVPQGTAAGILRRAIIKMDEEGFDFKVSTHDSVLIECVKGFPIEETLRSILTRDLPQALFVKMGRGDNWFAAAGGSEEVVEE